MEHLRNKGLKYLNNQKLLNKDIIEPLNFCEICELGKSHRVRFETGKHIINRRLDYVHLDL